MALIQNSTGSLTKDEEQLQYLLQVVAENRKRYPKALKRALLEPALAQLDCEPSDVCLTD